MKQMKKDKDYSNIIEISDVSYLVDFIIIKSCLYNSRPYFMGITLRGNIICSFIVSL